MPYVHVAVVDAVSARRLRNGERRIVPQLMSRPRSPLGCVSRGDHVLFRTRKGDVIGSARVGRVREFHGLTPGRVDRLRRVYGGIVSAPERIWSRRRSRHGVLIWLDPLRPPATGVRVPAPRRGTWAVLGRA